MSTTQPTFIGAIDQGTTSTRVLIFDKEGRTICISQKKHSQINPQQGWTEHDPSEVISNVIFCMEECAKKLVILGHSPSDVKCFGITNQRETICVWDKDSGLPIHNAIVWLDTRSDKIISSLTTQLGSVNALRDKTGLPLSTYFSAGKLTWLVENVSAVASALSSGQGLIGTMDSWIMFRLCGGVHLTDITNASRTQLFDINTLKWDASLCEMFKVPITALPEVKPSSSGNPTTSATPSSPHFGTIGFGPFAGCPVSGVAGDQQASLFGHLCFKPGDTKCTFGTGCFLLQLTNSGEPDPVIPSVAPGSGLFTTIAYGIGDKVYYAHEGSVASAGAIFEWLLKLGVVDNYQEIDALAASDSGGVTFVPAFSGLFAPRWRPDARGVIVGLTHHTGKAQLVRAAIEAVVLQTRELLTHLRPTRLYADGGLTRSDVMLDLLSDMVERTVLRPGNPEITSLGAATLAGLSVGVYRDLDEIVSLRAGGFSRFESSMSDSEREKIIARWEDAVGRSLNLAEITK